MLRIVAAVAVLCVFCIWSVGSAHARPSPYPGVTQFSGDRYAGTAQIAEKTIRPKRSSHGKYTSPARKRAPGARQRWQHVPMPVLRPLAEPGSVEPLTLFGGVGREASRVVGGRPAGCPPRFCGCGASLHLFGRIIPALNLAANWLRFPRAAPAPKMVAARRGHVFVLERHIAAMSGSCTTAIQADGVRASMRARLPDTRS